MGRHCAQLRKGTAIPEQTLPLLDTVISDFYAEATAGNSWDATWTPVVFIPGDGTLIVYEGSIAPGNEVALDDEINVNNGVSAILGAPQLGHTYFSVLTVAGYSGDVRFGPYQPS